MPTLSPIPRHKIKAIAEAMPDSQCAKLLQMERELGLIDCKFFLTDLGVMMIPKEREKQYEKENNY